MEDEILQNKINSILNEQKISFEVKKMFGGLCFMVDNKMCVGIFKPKNEEQPKLIARVGEYYYDSALKQPFSSVFDLTGRPMKGFIFLEKEGFDSQEKLNFWIEKCLEYIPLAKKR